MHYVGPEKGLIWAVLKRAIMDAAGVLETGGKWRRQGTAREAGFWIHEWHRDDASVPFTFPWCCEALDLDPIETRRRIRTQIANGMVARSSKNKTVCVGAYFADIAESPTQAEVYLL